MICGNFTTTDRGFHGEIRFFGFSEKVELLRIDGKESDRAPDFRIVAADDERVEFGPAWQNTSKAGRDYVSLKLNPVLAAPIYLRLVETRTAGKYVLLAD